MVYMFDIVLAGLRSFSRKSVLRDLPVWNGWIIKSIKRRLKLALHASLQPLPSLLWLAFLSSDWTERHGVVQFGYLVLVYVCCLRYQ